jgi:diguanylate cyclase (GGDEF)-like protein/PAS domain S-box-containing protein
MASMQTDEILAPWREAAIARMAFVLALTSMIAGIGFFLVQQVSGRQRMAAALASKEASFRLLAEGSSDMVTRIGLDGRISYASPSALRIVGWSPDQLIGTPALAGVHPLDLRRVKETAESLRLGRIEEARVAYRTRRRDRSEVWIEATLRVTRTTGGEIDGVVAVSRDVTEQKALEERLAILATHDGLTGLFNRRSFDDRLLAEWSRACRDGTTLSILMIDVDHFKKFNDQYGHPAGDQCLRSVARILASEIRRASDLAARYGGEEFAILLPNTDAAGCATIGQKIRRALEEAGMSHAQNLPSRRVTVSIGGASSRPDMNRSNGPAGLVEAADRALYAAKGRGRDQLVMAGEVVHLPLASSAARQ